MHGLDILGSVVLLLGTALIVAWFFRLIRVPTIIGFLFTGLVIGPSGFHFFASHDVESIGELGLVLLLFIVGLELSPGPLFRLGPNLLVATAMQVGVTLAAAALVVAAATSLGGVRAVLVGIVVALSSTAIVLKQISERGETESAAGLLTTGILLLQDVIALGFMVLLPVLAIERGGSWEATAVKSAIGLVVLASVGVVGRKVLPAAMVRLSRVGGPELMTLFAVLMACGGAWLADRAGWSPALGACAAGLALAEADARHQLAADIKPFRDVFNALFFISLGMMANVQAVASLLPALAVAMLATLAAKTVITSGAILAVGWPLRPAVQVGLGLCTVSEFGYVIGLEANKLGLLPPGSLDAVIVYAIGTMLFGAMLVPASGPIAGWCAQRFGRGPMPTALEGTGARPLSGHVVLIGFGVNGQNLVRVLQATRIPVCLIEMNPRLIQLAKERQVPVIMGDASRRSILEHAGIDHARAVVAATNDRQATRSIITQVRALRPDIYILARCRFITEMDELYRLGANQVIPEDFETSIEIAAHVLKQMNIPDNVVETQIAAVRAGRYGMLRGTPLDRAGHEELRRVLELTATRTHYLGDNDFACGKTIAQTELRSKTGVLIIAVVRNGKPATNPSAGYTLQAGDVLVLVGAHAQLEAAKAVLLHGAAPA